MRSLVLLLQAILYADHLDSYPKNRGLTYSTLSLNAWNCALSQQGVTLPDSRINLLTLTLVMDKVIDAYAHHLTDMHPYHSALRLDAWSVHPCLSDSVDQMLAFLSKCPSLNRVLQSRLLQFPSFQLSCQTSFPLSGLSWASLNHEHHRTLQSSQLSYTQPLSCAS